MIVFYYHTQKMESSMLKMIKNKNPDKEYPSNTGQKWTEEEESILLEELEKNIDVDTIAQSHDRTVGGINSRRKEISYKMYINNISMEQIIQKTKLEADIIMQNIKKKQNYTPKKTDPIKNKTQFSIESEIREIKNDINELKDTITQLVDMIKSVYEFEDA